MPQYRRLKTNETTDTPSNATVADIMVESVITTTAHKTVHHVRELMQKNRIHSIPVVDQDGCAIGIITSNDLLADHADARPIGQFMPRKVYTVPKYADVSIAAKIMRNQHIHHLVVTDEQKVVGILSAFDLLRLIEETRFAIRKAPSGSQRKSTRRSQEDDKRTKED